MSALYRIAVLNAVPPTVIHDVIEYKMEEVGLAPQWARGLIYRCEDGSQGSIGCAVHDQLLITRVR